MSLEQLDKEFAQFARQRAEKVAPGATWEEPDLPAEADSDALVGLAREASPEFRGPAPPGQRGWSSRRNGRRPGRSWNESRHFIRNTSGPENPYLLLAIVYRRLSDPAAEHKVLEELAMRDGDASPGLSAIDGAGRGGRRLEGVARNARRFLAVNPLVPAPHRELARAAGALGERDEALDGLPRARAARRHRPGRSPLPPGETAAQTPANRTRPGARSSGHWKKHLGSSTRISSCSSWSNTSPSPPAAFPPVEPLPKVGTR